MDFIPDASAAQLTMQIQQAQLRCIRLESDAQEVTSLLSSAIRYEATMKNTHESELAELEKQVEELSVAAKKTTSIIRALSMQLRTALKKELVSSLSLRIDSWPLESFITRKEFMAALEDATRLSDS